MKNNENLTVQEIIGRIRQKASQEDIKPEKLPDPDKDSFSQPLPGFFSYPYLDVDKKSFNLEELLNYHDRTFITRVYQAILKRDPDPDGLENYLRLLRSNKWNKRRFIAELSNSPEGRSKNIEVRGLFRERIKFRLLRLPYVGKVVDYLLALISLRRFRADIDMQHALLGQFIEESGQALSSIDSNIRGRLREKADKEELKEKVGPEEFDRYMRSVNHVLDMVRSLYNEEVKKETKAPARVNTYSGQWLDEFYLAFEDAFRGPRSEILDRLRTYLPLITHALDQAKSDRANENLHLGSRVLDLGCGRGEWLELLAQNNIQAVGVDLNRSMVKKGRQNGLDIVEGDIFSFLEALPADCLTAVSAFHLIEHLSFDHQLRLLDECRRVLAPNGVLILETPNLRNILVGAGDFYRDPTHIKPLHPETLLFMVQHRGFVRSRIFYFEKTGSGHQLVDSFLVGFQDLQDYVTVSRDYAMVGYKP
jgi:SAM-dependent methyltransferase